MPALMGERGRGPGIRLVDEEVRVYQMDVRKRFSGDLGGTSEAWLVMTTTPPGPAAYVGFEVLDVTIGERRGTFFLKHDTTATSDGLLRWMALANRTDAPVMLVGGISRGEVEESAPLVEGDGCGGHQPGTRRSGHRREALGARCSLSSAPGHRAQRGPAAT